MHNRIKIAVCYFGITRAPEITVPSIEENVLKPLRAMGRVETFAHLYELDRVINPRNGEDHAVDPEAWRILKPDFARLEKPEEANLTPFIEEVKTFGDAFENDFVSMTNLVLQLNSLAASFEISRRCEHDIWVFIRPDLQYHDSFTGTLRAGALTRRRQAILPNWQQWRCGFNDRFAICAGEEAASAYARRIDDILDFCRREGPLHAELLLKHSLEKRGIRVRETTLRASRVRSNGAVVQEEFRSTARLEARAARIQAAIRLLDRLGIWRVIRPIARRLVGASAAP